MSQPGDCFDGRRIGKTQRSGAERRPGELTSADQSDPLPDGPVSDRTVPRSDILLRGAILGEFFAGTINLLSAR